MSGFQSGKNSSRGQTGGDRGGRAGRGRSGRSDDSPRPGPNRHMGLVPALSKITGYGDMIQVMNEGYSRASLIDSTAEDYSPHSARLPGRCDERKRVSIGAPLNPSVHKIKTNCFLITRPRAAVRIFQYSVQIFSVRDGRALTEDLTSSMDKEKSIILLRNLTNGPVLAAYDGRSILYSVNRIPPGNLSQGIS